jgi:hypothetical protein
MVPFISSLDVGVHGAGSVVRNFVPNIVILILVRGLLQQEIHTISVASQNQDLRERNIVREDIIVIVKSDGKGKCLSILADLEGDYADRPS